MTREEKIKARLEEHYCSLLSKGYRIVGLFLIGSQNYDLDIEDENYCSDIDTKAIVVPTFNQFAIGAR